MRWQGERRDPEALKRLEDRLVQALCFLERFDRKVMSDRRWRSLASERPLRLLPEDALLEPVTAARSLGWPVGLPQRWRRR